MTRILLFITTLLFSTAMFAQESGDAAKPAFPPAQPPPDMDALGTAPALAVPAPVNSVKAGHAAPSAKTSPAMNVPNEASAPQRAQATTDKSSDGPVAGGMPELPVVTVRKEGNDTVEEYRRNGKVFMVRIMPQDGPAHYYLDRTGNGRLDRDPLDTNPGPISPVYFKIYDWK